MKKFQTAAGFTLVELALALMIIGLIIAGVLKGIEISENAKVTQVIRQAQGYDTAVISFLSIYQQLPGDIRNPSEKLAGCTTAPCNIAGNGDGNIGPDTTDLTDFYAAPVVNENITFWEHLSKAGLIKEYNPAANFPKAPIINAAFKNRTLNIPAGANYPKLEGFYYGLVLANGTGPILTAAQALQLDLKIDDGKPFSGNIMAMDAGAGESCINGLEYNLVAEPKVCNLLMKMLKH